MSGLEQEIIEKFHQLQPAARRRIRALIEEEIAAELDTANTSVFDYETWLHNVETLRQQIRAGHGDKLLPVDVVGVLRAIRDGENE